MFKSLIRILDSFLKKRPLLSIVLIVIIGIWALTPSGESIRFIFFLSCVVSLFGWLAAKYGKK